jgi:hypothetical protein
MCLLRPASESIRADRSIVTSARYASATSGAGNAAAIAEKRNMTVLGKSLKMLGAPPVGIGRRSIS